MNSLLLLVDGSSYFYRAFHALPPLVNSKGQATGAIYGVVNMLKRLLKDYSPEHVAVIFDAKGKNFRHDLYSQYKAHRPPMPDELSSQFEPLIEIIKAMGLPVIIEQNVEADDVIATLTHQAEDLGLRTLISTGDKDLAQLVSEKTTLINTMTQTHFDRTAVVEKFGIPPERIVDYLSLMGDKIDNVPGVAGVGPKTAVQWLTTYGSLDNLIACADDIKGKVGETLRNSLEQLALSRQLTTLKNDISLNCSFETLRQKPLDNQKWLSLLQELEFKAWLKSAEKDNPPVSAPPTLLASPEALESATADYTTLFTQEALLEWLEYLKTSTYFAISIIGTDPNPLNAQLIGISFAISLNKAAYLPLGHHYIGAPQQLDTTYVLSLLKPIFENPDLLKIGQNLKYDFNILKNFNINLQGSAFDTLLESYMQNSYESYADQVTLAHKTHQTTTLESLVGKGAKQLNFSDIDIDKAAVYAAENARLTLALHEHLWPSLALHEKTAQAFTTIEMPLIPILAEMEHYGVLIDAHCLHQQSIELTKRLKILETSAFELAGEPFNLQSPKQLQHILFEKHQLPVLQKTPKGQASTGEEVLQELSLSYPLPKIILEYRSLIKLKSTYTDALPQCIHPKTGRVHTSYNQAVTSTGRLSSSQPNLQNIPIRTEEGRRIRKAFIAPSGYQLLSADYSQIELRLMAHLSQDPGLLWAFSNGLDIHQATAAEINAIPLEEVTTEQRRHAKAINFGLIYGMSAFGLAKQLGISREAAQHYITRYFLRYPKVQAFMEETRQYARQHGWVETISGRRMMVAEINSKNAMRQRAAERAAINAPLQGSAADIIKLAMIHAAEWIKTAGLDVKMIMQVHDELVFEIKEEVLDEAKTSIKHIMENAVSLCIPLEVSVGTGLNWDEAH